LLAMNDNAERQTLRVSRFGARCVGMPPRSYAASLTLDSGYRPQTAPAPGQPRLNAEL